MRSAFMWFLPWLLAAVVGIGALWIGIDAALGGDEAGPATDPPGRPAAAADPSSTPEDDVSETPIGETSPPPAETLEPDAQPDEKKRKKQPPELISSGVSIQVLNGTSDSDLGDRVADKLEGLGFEIVAVNPWHTTTETVVYWSQPTDEKAAMLLADKFGWSAEPKPADLSTEVSLHILVGGDEV